MDKEKLPNTTFSLKFHGAFAPRFSGRSAAEIGVDGVGGDDDDDGHGCGYATDTSICSLSLLAYDFMDIAHSTQRQWSGFLRPTSDYLLHFPAFLA